MFCKVIIYQNKIIKSKFKLNFRHFEVLLFCQSSSLVNCLVDKLSAYKVSVFFFVANFPMSIVTVF